MVSSLEARGIEFAYAEGTPVLSGVDLEVASGELVCVLGPNGSGKTTLLRILTGTLAATRGSVSVESVPLADIGARARARAIAAVPQVLAALPDADVESFVLGGRYAYLGLFGRAREGDREAVARALQEADAASLAGRHLGELSGGQCQRVLVARALAQEARLLLFDEPTAALDPEHQVLSFELFRRLVREDRAAVVATHELALAGRFADRVVVLHRGRVAASGPPGEVLTREILEPVYGRHLLVTAADDGAGGERPVVVPWPASVPESRK